MRTFFTPPPSLFDTDPLEISRFGVRLANENQTFWPMENQTDHGIKRPMEIKQNGNQTTNRKSNPNRFRNAKRFRNRFVKIIKRPMEIKQKESNSLWRIKPKPFPKACKRISFFYFFFLASTKRVHIKGGWGRERERERERKKKKKQRDHLSSNRRPIREYGMEHGQNDQRDLLLHFTL